MISLSDDELAAIMDAARPIDPRERDQFLRDSSPGRADDERDRAGPAVCLAPIKAAGVQGGKRDEARQVKDGIGLERQTRLGGRWMALRDHGPHRSNEWKRAATAILPRHQTSPLTFSRFFGERSKPEESSPSVNASRCNHRKTAACSIKERCLT
jgi:hypothetical protein